MKIIHTGDWHIGSPRSPYRDGVNLRSLDTERCLDRLVETAQNARPDLTLISGDVFDVGKVWSDRCCAEIVTAAKYIRNLALYSGSVVVMRGTPNHDGAGQFQALREMLSGTPNVIVATEPGIYDLEGACIVCVPGFDAGIFAANHPGLSKEDRNEAITAELSNIVLGLRAACPEGKPAILMAHYTVPGADINAGQTSMLTQFEPCIPAETLQAADFDLVALGHIHRPQAIDGIRNCYYCGGINTSNFGDEGQDRGFWIHTMHDDCADSEFVITPYRGFYTVRLDNADITNINMGHIKDVAMRRWAYAVCDRIVRVRFSCTDDNNKALSRAALSCALLRDGAFMVWEILPDQIEEYANRTELCDATDPEENLALYLKEKEVEPERIHDLALKARPIIQEAMAHMTTAAYTGTFEPVSIAVKNYRNYAEETFDFTGISFCTINGVNGSGKSSLFMDAVMDCLYEEPREGEKTGWIRNDEKARSGSIIFTFRIGGHTFRVARTRTRSGKGTLNIAELMDGDWEDRSCEKYLDTQKRIVEIIGMDSMTFKSCALIMQDQYGIFLQAAPDERVKVLGTLLGLDVYRQAEKIAADKGRAFGAESRDIKSRIEAHEHTIAELGDPGAELEGLEKDLRELKESKAYTQAQRDEKQASLAKMREASERKLRLLDEISSFDVKINAADVRRNDQISIVVSNGRILDGRSEIEAGVAEYNALVDREHALAAEAALYASKLSDAAGIRERITAVRGETAGHEVKLAAQREKLDALNVPVDEEAIRRDVEECEKYERLLAEQDALRDRFMAVYQKKADAENAVWSKGHEAESRIGILKARLSDLKQRAEMLKDSGCPDIESASCRFLADAKAAMKKIPEAEAELASYRAESEKEIAALTDAVSAIEADLAAIGYDGDLRSEYQARVQDLKGARGRLSEFEKHEAEKSLVAASIEAEELIIAANAATVSALEQRAQDADEECGRYEKSAGEHADAKKRAEKMKIWVERERELPVAVERMETARKRVEELDAEIEQLEAEKARAKKEAEGIKVGDVKGMKWDIEFLDKILERDGKEIEEKQIRIGAVRQTLGQIEAVKAQVAELRKAQTKAAKEVADYDTLKLAFSAPGVPHQIIRSIVPALTATANQILGQMTGGTMGVEFRLERLQKNGKEKTALDIYIAEGEQAPLPYLSKSGGEKVKASLSVILALAEVKSSSVGVRMGFISIDEPPFLDSDGTQAYCDALETIRHRYPDMKIMAITHDPAFKARFPQSVDVVKTDSGSKVVY